MNNEIERCLLMIQTNKKKQTDRQTDTSVKDKGQMQRSADKVLIETK